MTIEKIVNFLRSKYDFHCAILYGSRAGVHFRPESDYDFLCIQKEGERIREIIHFEDSTIDLIIDNEDLIERPKETSYLWQSKIMHDEFGFAKTLVDSTIAFLARPPEALTLARVTQRKKQMTDFLIYATQEGILGDYRRHGLLAKLLPLYCDFSRLWYLGDKHLLEWLEKNDLKTFELFQKAFLRNASISDIEKLVLHLSSI